MRVQPVMLVSDLVLTLAVLLLKVAVLKCKERWQSAFSQGVEER